MPSYGDVHPVTDKIFIGYQRSCANGERWVTPEKFITRLLFLHDYIKSERSRNVTKKRRNTDAERAKRNAYGKTYRKRSHVKERANKYQRDRRRRDALFAIQGRYRARLTEILKWRKIPKNRGTRDFLGCSWGFFESYLESKFLPGMSWENRILWEIDHIVPLSSARTEDDIFKLSHYTNLQPLWARENRAKGAKLIDTRL